MSIEAELRRAVEAGVITLSDYHAIAGCITHHDGGAFSLDTSDLTEQELDALDAVIVWLDEVRE